MPTFVVWPSVTLMFVMVVSLNAVSAGTICKLYVPDERYPIVKLPVVSAMVETVSDELKAVTVGRALSGSTVPEIAPLDAVVMTWMTGFKRKLPLSGLPVTTID